MFYFTLCRLEVGLRQMTEEISANKKGNLPLSVVPVPAFDLCLPPLYALAKSVCYANARNS